MAAAILLNSCTDAEPPRKTGPIVMGDSSTIVTETDPKYLRDMVADIDIKPNTADTEPVAATTATPAKTEVKAEEPKPATVEKGFEIDCGSYKIVLAGVGAKEYKKQNAASASGLSYALTSGNINSSKLIVTGDVKNLAVKQRYQSQLILDGSQGKVALTDLGLFTSGWNTVKVSGNSAPVAGLNGLQFSSVNNNKIKNAADRALRKSKASSKTIQAWMKDIRKVNKAGDSPSEIVLNNVQWQISGTDKSGKSFTKTVRMDVPL